jgi:hypothetical protein
METLMIKHRNGEDMLPSFAYQVLTNVSQAGIVDYSLYWEYIELISKVRVLVI